MIRRRSFLLAFTSFLLFAAQGGAYPLDRILGHPPKEFIQLYISRFWKWYQKKWFNFSAQMSEAEKELWHHWLDHVQLFGRSQPKGVYIENFLTRHCLSKNKRLSGTYYAGLPLWTPAGLKLLQKLTAEKAPRFQWKDWHKQQIFGWSHNYDANQFRLWFLNPQKGLFFTEHKPLLGYIEFGKDTEVKRGAVFHSIEVPTSIHKQLDSRAIISGFRMLDSMGNESWKVRTRSTFLLSLKRGIQWVSAKHQMEFKQVPDFLDVGKDSSDTLKVYYP